MFVSRVWQPFRPQGLETPLLESLLTFAWRKQAEGRWEWEERALCLWPESYPYFHPLSPPVVSIAMPKVLTSSVTSSVTDNVSSIAIETRQEAGILPPP